MTISATFTGIVTGSYAVTVVTQPAGQRCAVMGGSGTATANVTTVSVTCTSLFTIGGTLSGLPRNGDWKDASSQELPRPSAPGRGLSRQIHRPRPSSLLT
jgi:hypothetical protein